MKFCVNLSRFNASTNYIVKSYCSWKHREILHWGRASAGSHIRTLNLTTTLAGIQVASLRIFHYARGPVTTVILPYSRERVPCHYNTTVFHTPRPTNPYSVHVHSHPPPPPPPEYTTRRYCVFHFNDTPLGYRTKVKACFYCVQIWFIVIINASMTLRDSSNTVQVKSHFQRYPVGHRELDNTDK